MCPTHTPRDLTLAHAQQVLAAQPFSVLLDARVVSFGAGEAVLEVPLRPDLRQQNGYAHGGVISYLADNALTFAGGSVLGPAVLTAGFAITYLRPAQGSSLAARAHVVDSGTNRALVDVLVVAREAGREDVVVASAQGTIRRAAPQDT